MRRRGSLQVRSVGLSTEYRIVGDREFVLERIAFLKAEYPSAGYGTEFRLVDNVDGEMTVVGSRLSYCD